MVNIQSPQDVRREVNNLLGKRSAPHAEGQRASKWRSISTDIDVDFSSSRWSKALRASDLAALIRDSPRVEDISLHEVEIEGDFRLVLEALRGQHYVSGFALYSCRLGGNYSRELGETLATLPRLRKLHFCCLKEPELPILSVLTPVLEQQRECFRKIFVNGFHTPQDDAVVNRFWAALEVSTGMRDLTCCPLGRNSFRQEHLAKIGDVVRNNTSLSTLDFQVMANVSLVSLAADLQANTTLRKLVIDRNTIRFDGSTSFVVQELEQFASALRTHNFVLRELEVGQWTVQQTTEDSPEREHLQAVEFYLNLNQLGRQHLIANANNQGATHEDWMDAIANRDDPSVIYYFLRKNPSICRYTPSPEVVSTSDSTPPVAREREQALHSRRMAAVSRRIVSPEDLDTPAMDRRDSSSDVNNFNNLPEESEQVIESPVIRSPVRAIDFESPDSPASSDAADAAESNAETREESENLVLEPSNTSVAPLLSLMGVLNGAMFAVGYYLGAASTNGQNHF